MLSRENRDGPEKKMPKADQSHKGPEAEATDQKGQRKPKASLAMGRTNQPKPTSP